MTTILNSRYLHYKRVLVIKQLMRKKKMERAIPNLSKLVRELLGNGWKLNKDVDMTINRVEGKISFPVFGNGEGFITDAELIRTAENQGSAFGQGDAEWLFDHQDKLVDCPPQVRHLMFPGTEWEHPNGALLWPYLYRRNQNNEWGLYVFWRDFGFSAEHTRLIKVSSEKA